MRRKYRKYGEDFTQGAVELVFETGKPIAQVARELGINEGTLGNWCATARRQAGEGNGELGETERAELPRLRKEIVELRMQRDAQAFGPSHRTWPGPTMAGTPARDPPPGLAPRHHSVPAANVLDAG